MISRMVRVLSVALAAALATAALHLTVTTVEREVFGRFSWMWWSRDQLWVTPLSYAIVFVVLGVLPAILHGLWPTRIRLTLVASAYAALSTLCVLLLFPRIATWAWVLVALGVGIQVLRALRSRDEVALTWSKRLAVGLGGLFALLGGGSYWIGERAERLGMASLADAPAGAPNVLLLILDTVRASDMSVYGAGQPTTPALERRAKEGVVFEQAFSTAPWTLPSHASMFTGHYAGQQSADWKTPLDTTQATIAEVLRDRGYATGGFVANLIATSYRTGLARGFVRYEDLERSWTEVMYNTTLAQSTAIARAWQVWRERRWLGGALRQLATFDLRPNGNYTSHERKNAADVAGDFLRWQATLDGRPFFAFLNLFDAHGPYEPPAYRDTFAPNGRALGRYRGAIRYLDEQVDLLLHELDRRGVLSNTIVVITSDHGELFGEHKLSGHGNGLYLPLLHVPFVVLAPGRAAPGTRIASAVSLRDLPATLLDLVGSAPNERGIGGVSLAPLLTGTGPVAVSRSISEVNRGINDDVRNPTAVADLKSVIDDTLHAIADSRGRLQAWHYRSDPAEAIDLAADPARRLQVARWVDGILDSSGVRWPRRLVPRVPTALGDTVPGPASR